MSGCRVDVGRNSDLYDMGKDDCASMAACTLPCDLMMNILWLAAEIVGFKMSEVGLMIRCSVERTCLMAGRNHGGEMEP